MPPARSICSALTLAYLNRVNMLLFDHPRYSQHSRIDHREIEGFGKCSAEGAKPNMQPGAVAAMQKRGRGTWIWRKL